jgi:lysophospholipase L1-like esterase
MVSTTLACSSSTPDSADPYANWDERSVRERCFEGLGDESRGLPEYDAFAPTIGHHCDGTNHQDIKDVGRVVFLGDSVTAGTPPTPVDQLYRPLLTNALVERFGQIQVDDCSAYGARTDDLLLEPHEQIATCFPEIEARTTLVVLTMGGNDMFAFAEDMRDGMSAADVMVQVDTAADLMHDAISWFRSVESERFTGGVFVMFGNVYEFTDGEGDLASCPNASLFGFEGTIPELRDAYIHMNERYVKTAVETGTDVIFMLEHFCGHGFHAGEEDNECYRGPNAEQWFDATCIHPTPAGHARIAEMFTNVVDE